MFFLRKECERAGTCSQYEQVDCQKTPAKDKDKGTNEFPRCYVHIPEAQETAQKSEKKRGLLAQLFCMD